MAKVFLVVKLRAFRGYWNLVRKYGFCRETGDCRKAFQREWYREFDRSHTEAWSLPMLRPLIQQPDHYQCEGPYMGQLRRKIKVARLSQGRPAHSSRPDSFADYCIPDCTWHNRSTCAEVPKALYIRMDTFTETSECEPLVWDGQWSPTFTLIIQSAQV